MKIENYDRVSFLVQQIGKNERTIRQIQGMYTKVILKENDGTLIQTIGLDPGCEHDLHQFAVQFMNKCVTFYTEQNEKYTRELETL